MEPHSRGSSTPILHLFVITIVLHCSHGDRRDYSFRCLESGRMQLFGVHKSSSITIEANCSNKEPVQDDNGLFLIDQTCTVLHCSNGDRRDYSFRCLESGGIQLFGVHKSSSIRIEANCSNKEPVQDDNGLFLIDQTCMLTTNNKSAVNITVFDKAFGENASYVPRKISGVVSERSHKITLVCHELPRDGINKTVVKVMQAENYNILPEVVKEVADVEMRFKAGNHTELPDISTVYVGDEFYMFLKYMGNSAVVLVPDKCTAYGGSSIFPTSEYSQVLWKRFYSPCTVEKTLMEDFQTINNTMVMARMYGFRFINSRYITILCNVRIYLSTSNPQPDRCVTRTPPPPGTTKSTTTATFPTPALPTNNPLPTSSSRRRRSYDREYDTLNVNKILWIKDSKVSAARAGAVPMHKPIMPLSYFSMVVFTCALQRHFWFIY